MSGDRFDEAVRALRDRGETSPEDVRRVRRRVLESMKRPESRPRRLSPWLLPIAAVLAATTALAATGTLPAVVQSVKEIFTPAPAASTPTVNPTPTSALTSTQVSPAETKAPESAVEPAPPPVETPPAPVAAAVEPPPRAQSAAPKALERTSAPATSIAASSPSAAKSAPAPTPAPAPAAPEPNDEAERTEVTRYRSAHALHFGVKNYAVALPAWDSYLSSYPAGTFVDEARYNRAICLLELGRTKEAEAALRPFADGRIQHGYRQREARALLEAMDAGK